VKNSQASDTPHVGGAAPEADLAGVLHEVSNALTVVLGWLDAARTKVGSGAALEAVEVARAHAQLGYRMARNAIGATVGVDDERCLHSVAREAALGVTQEARRNGVRVHVDFADAPDVELHDGMTAYQILMNLLLNAIAFTPVGGIVTVSLGKDGSRAVFRVTDEGPGIEAERAETVFSGPVSTREGGAGIGLSYAASLAKSRGGELVLLGSGPGATFELRWPLEKARSVARPRSQSTSVSLAGMRVLLVEDDAAVSSLIEFALETHEIEVLMVSSPEQLVEMFEAGEKFDAALIDLSPFEEDTGKALALLKNAARDGASLILISGLVTSIPPELEGRIAAWVRKPFEMNEVIQVLRRLRGGD